MDLRPYSPIIMISPRTVGFLSLLAAIAWTAGCGPAVDVEVSAQRAKYLLTSEPPDALGVLDARDAMSGSQQVVLVGRIGGVPDPWTAGQAAFVIADPALLTATAADAHSCSDGCAFCPDKTHDNTSSLALVQFVDLKGQVLPIDARKLFGLSARQMVVVRGEAKVDELGYLVVSANGLYIRR